MEHGNMLFCWQLLWFVEVTTARSSAAVDSAFVKVAGVIPSTTAETAAMRCRVQVCNVLCWLPQTLIWVSDAQCVQMLIMPRVRLGVRPRLVVNRVRPSSHRRWHQLLFTVVIHKVSKSPGLTQFALRQYRRDLRTLARRRVNKEQEETSLHFLGKCCATANVHRLHFGIPFLEPGELKQAHWITLLRFAKTTKRFQ